MKTATEQEYEVRLVHVQLVEVVDNQAKTPLVTRKPAHDERTGAALSTTVSSTTVKATRNIDAMRLAMGWADTQMVARSLRLIRTAFVRDGTTGKLGVQIRAATERTGTFPIDAGTTEKKTPAPKRSPARRKSKAKSPAKKPTR